MARPICCSVFAENHENETKSPCAVTAVFLCDNYWNWRSVQVHLLYKLLDYEVLRKQRNSIAK